MGGYKGERRYDKACGCQAEKGLVPDVRGMSLRDAIYLLENSGLRVKYSGKGRSAGNRLNMVQEYMKDSIVSLDLNM